MAVAALQKILEDFKNDTQVAQDLQPTLQKLRLMYAQQMLDELGLRQIAGSTTWCRESSRTSPKKTFRAKSCKPSCRGKKDYKAFDEKRKAVDPACRH